MAQRKVSREDQLLEVATRFFKEKGYHNTSMQDLADGLGVQKASLYYYIDSKEDLLRQLLERAASLLGAQVDEIYAADLPPAEKLCLALENHAVTMMENLNLVSVYLHEYRNLPPPATGGNPSDAQTLRAGFGTDIGGWHHQRRVPTCECEDDHPWSPEDVQLDTSVVLP